MIALSIVLLTLVLERVLRLFEFAAANNAAMGLVFQMAANLVPHYLGLALPAAFFISILLLMAQLGDDNELDVIAQYMGHDIRIHREYYRLPDGTMQISKVAKMLMSLNKGKLPTENELHDDAIEYEVDEESSDDDDHGDNDEMYHSKIGKQSVCIYM